MTAEERVCKALGVSYLTYRRLFPTHLDRQRIDGLAAAFNAYAAEMLEELLAVLDAHPDIDSRCFEVIDDEIARRLATLRPVEDAHGIEVPK